MYKAKIYVTLRPSILDPKGKASHQALQSLGMHAITGVRMGKLIELDITADNEEQAHVLATDACEKLLANTVMEDYTIQISPKN